MNREPFVTDQYYHVYNRGTDKRVIFNDATDYRRFVLAIKEFNTKDSVLLRTKKKDVETKSRQDSPLVEIVCWTLMPNHFHLLIKQLEDGGIAKFLQKLCVGYTMYFNKRYERSGNLFQGVTKSVIIDDDAQLLHVARYIHLNPLDLFVTNWKNEGIVWDDAKPLLYSYPWSNFRSFSKTNNENEIILEQLEQNEGYEKFLSDWTKKELAWVKYYTLED